MPGRPNEMFLLIHFGIGLIPMDFIRKEGLYAVLTPYRFLFGEMLELASLEEIEARMSNGVIAAMDYTTQSATNKTLINEITVVAGFTNNIE
jgi:hypothetical protein